MDKDKILASAKKDKQKGQEYENQEMKKNGNWSLLGGVIVATIMILIEYFKCGTLNVALIVTLSIMAGIMNFLDGIKVRKKLWIFCGVLELCLFVLFFAYFLFKVV